MTVGELLEKLRKLDSGMPVVTANYEVGYDDLTEATVIELVLGANDFGHDGFGPHELAENLETAKRRQNKCKALLLGALQPSLIKEIEGSSSLA